VLHLDTAACGVPSRATLAALTAHVTAEAVRGGYVAEAAAAPVLEAAAGDLLHLLGAPPGWGTSDVAWVGSAFDAVALAVGHWPLPRGARVGVLAADYGPHRSLLLERLVPLGGALVELPADPVTGVAEPSAWPAALDGLALVSVCQVASHDGAQQPAAELAAACCAAGVPLLLDVAQALGQVPVGRGDSAPADVVVGTSRKWLHGPRGVGFLAASPAVVAALRTTTQRPTPGWDGRTADTARCAADLTAGEAPVAARVGLARALAELRAAGPERVHRRVAAAGGLLAGLLAEVPGWRVSAGTALAAGQVTLLAPEGFGPGDVVAVRAALLREGILASAIAPERCPPRLRRPVLRFSPAVGVTADELARVPAALHHATHAAAAAGGVRA
jgi:pyridoxal 5-phosphate dependent beta-lyase